MSQDFKGKAGGDPSRKPPLVTITFQCCVCEKAVQHETRKPESFVLPETCSRECEAALIRNKAKELITQILGEDNTPESGSIPQRIAEEVLQAHRWLERAELGEVVIVQIVCAHCKKTADRFAVKNATKKNGPSIYCSFACRESKASKLPQGVACRSPRKQSHSTALEAYETAEKLNVQLYLEEGDSEGVTPYACTCGQWHTGHRSKREWLEAANAAITIINTRITELIHIDNN